MNLRSVSMTAVALSAPMAVGGADVDAQVRLAHSAWFGDITLSPK
jgi:hypothetical protein